MYFAFHPRKMVRDLPKRRKFKEPYLGVGLFTLYTSVFEVDHLKQINVRKIPPIINFERWVSFSFVYFNASPWFMTVIFISIKLIFFGQ